ncbi:hypothetical protein LTR53_001007 [Teratosphaeriaceae sp. CCFEE 6253]|nr:hypothetical protein LTR53_001007 [Teratosphaeriaceae sp. CCFEE 6253]
MDILRKSCSDLLVVVLVAMTTATAHRVLAQMAARLQRRLMAWSWPDYTARILDFLAASFHNPAQLLRGMGNASCILTGPRALEFHHPGCIDANAEWTFVTHPSAYCVGLAMQALQTAGVVWEDSFEPIREIAAAQSGEILPIHLRLLKEHVRRAAFGSVTRPALGPSMDAVLKHVAAVLQHADVVGAPVPEYVRLPNGVVIHVDQSKYGGPYRSGSPSWVAAVIGHTTYNGTHQAVRLISKAGKLPIEHVLDFSASSVQCFVTAFGAGHLYDAMAKKRRAYYWPNNAQYKSGSTGNLDSDSCNQFTYSRAPASPVQDRRLGIGGSRFMAFDLQLYRGHSVRQVALRNLRWQVSEGETRFVPTEPKSFRDALYGSCLPRDLAVTRELESAKARAVEACVGIDEAQDNAHPRQLPGW